MTDNVQPDEGQGAEATGGLFDSYLQNVPEDGREVVTSYLKNAEKNVNSRLQEAAELQKTLGPYKDVQGLSQYQPEQLNELLAWHQQVTSSDEAFQQWLAETAEEAGFTKAEAQELEDLEDSGQLSQKQIEQLVAQKAQEQIQPFQQKMESWEQERALNDETSFIQTELKTIEAEHGELTQEQQEAVLKLGEDVEGTDWVQKGYQRFQALVGDAQKAFVDGKVNQPKPSLSAGGQEAFKPATSFKDAGEQARERFRAMQQ